MKRALALVAVPALAISLAACGDDSGDAKSPAAGHSTPASGAPSGGSQAKHNDQDVRFAQMMIPHHRQAIEMADLAAARAGSPEVKRLAADIEKAQDPEIKQLSSWLTGWGASVPSPGTGHMGHGGMDGMMTEQQMKELKDAEGAAFDQAFLQMMIEHHDGAVAMARTEQSAGRFPAAKKMASAIVTAQSAEITKMRKLLKR